MLVITRMMCILLNFSPKCFAATGHNLRRGSIPTFSAVTWLQHTNTCSICSEMQKKSKGGRPPNRKNVGRPMCTKQSGDTTSINVKHIMQLDRTKALSDAHEKALAYMISIKASQSTAPNK